MAAVDEARNVARAVRRLRNLAERYAARTGAVDLFDIGNAIERLANVMTAGQARWAAFNARPLTNGQKRQILSAFFADVNADFTAQLGAGRTALTAAETTFANGSASVAPNGDRTWNVTNHAWDKPTITKAQRSTLDTRLIAVRDALPALAV